MQTHNDSQKCLKNIPRKSAVIKGYVSIRLRTAQNDSLNRDLYVSFLHDGISSLLIDWNSPVIIKVIVNSSACVLMRSASKWIDIGRFRVSESVRLP